jgi:Kef-type K+ transport system membrane component KefB
MLGQLLAGVILGPPLLDIVGVSPSIDMIAELGIFFVMFHTGMEMDPKELIEHVWPSLAVGLGGFFLPFILAYITTRLFGGTFFQSLFIATAVSVTAIAVQAVILHSMKINKSELGHIIMGAAIVEEIFALIALSTLVGLAKTGSVQILQISTILLKVVGFFALTIFIGYFIMPRVTRRLTNRKEKTFMLAITSALLMAYFAELAGLHLIIGAFLAGQFVREEIMDDAVYESVNSHFFAISYGFLVPIFFASLSFHLHLYWNWSFIFFTLVVTLVAIAGKLIGCGVGAAVFGYNFWESIIIGFGMNGRGAVELVFASIVLKISDQLMVTKAISEPLLTQDQFSTLVLMAFITTLIAPISLKWAVKRTCLPAEKVDFCRLWDEHKIG